MCGIAGKVDFAGPVDRDVVARMCAALEHRGPDSRGLWSDHGVCLGVQRLAIIDVAGGDQPIFNEDRSIAVVMNGEIYNFATLRHSLERRGHSFRTHTDTEVLVHLYEEHGDDLVQHLRGMFAFAIWDASRQRLLLGRDRVGKKPLFVVRKGTRVWFASEVMALLQDPEIQRDPNPQAILNYLTYQYVPHPLSAFADLEKVPPATTVAITAGHMTRRRYWHLRYDETSPAHQVEIEERLRQLIWEATRLRLVSDVPLGAFLSGGIDSSAVVAAMADQTHGPVKTFSVGFVEDEFNEVRYARLVADRFATDHHELIVEPSVLELMPRLARHYGEPFADASALPSFYLANLTAQHVTVALNGDGGDENFAGYRRYVANVLAARLDRLPGFALAVAGRCAEAFPEGGRTDSPRARARRLGVTLAMTAPQRYAYWSSAFTAPMHQPMLQPHFLATTSDYAVERVIEGAWCESTARTILDRLLDTDVNTYLPDDLLVKMDVATMAHSLEGRSPLLDHHLMEFAASIPTNLKARRGAGKIILKSALRGIVPDAVLDRPKMGFGVPLRRWFREELRDLPRELLLASDTRCHAYVRPEAIHRMLAEHQAAAIDHSARIWTLLQLEYWHREVLESPSPCR